MQKLIWRRAGERASKIWSLTIGLEQQKLKTEFQSA
jgi:hypothetical protein